jgi:hypothetical protein
MIRHNFLISALYYRASASGVCCSRGKISWPISASHDGGVQFGDKFFGRTARKQNGAAQVQRQFGGYPWRISWLYAFGI